MPTKGRKDEQNKKVIRDAVNAINRYLLLSGKWYSIDELYNIMCQAYKKEMYSKATIEEAIKRLKLSFLLYSKIKDGVFYYRHRNY